MKVKDIVEIIDAFAPFADQSQYDHSGLQVGDADATVRGILVAVDLTPKVIEEAYAKGCDLIITHHPAIWVPLCCVLESDYVGRMVRMLIEKGIAYIAAHTNVDKCVGGNSERLVALLGGRVTGRMEIDPFFVTFDMPPIGLRALILKVRAALDDPTAYAVGADDVLTKGALCTGAGADDEIIRACLQEGRVCLTGECKHHQLRYVEHNNGHLICFGHFTSEKIFVTIIIDVLHAAGIEALPSEQGNPCIIG